MNSARIIGSAGWRALAGRRVLNRRVLLSGCGDIHLCDIPRIEVQASTVYVTGCDMNFAYYWLRPSVFTGLKRLYLDSHPCEASVIERFPSTEIVLNERYKKYNNAGMRVQIMEPEHMRIIISEAQIDSELLRHENVYPPVRARAKART